MNGNTVSNLILGNHMQNRLPFFVGISMIIIVIVDLLMTRQLLSYDPTTGRIMFVLTIIVGYGFGTYVLLVFAHHVSKGLRQKSRLSSSIHWSVIVIQTILLCVLIVMLLYGNPDYIFSRFVFAISSVLATAIMTVLTYKFFSWYKASKYKNSIVLFYALATLTLACSIIEDFTTKFFMIDIIFEDDHKSDTAYGSSFQYKQSDKFGGQVVFIDSNKFGTSYFVIPSEILETYNLLNSIILPVGFVFRWIASTMLLRNIYQKFGSLPIWFWIILSLPLVLYIIGKMPGFFSGESLTGIDEAYRYFFRILFRLGTIAGNILFGLAFFIVANKMKSSKIKDFLILAGIGDTIVGISLSTSAVEPTFGVAAHSLVLLSTYLFMLGLYSSAITVSQDLKLRQSIRDSAIEESRLLVSIGSAQMIQEIEKKVIGVVEYEKIQMAQSTGLQSTFTDQDTREYLKSVLKEIKIIHNVEDIISKSKNILIDSREFILCTKTQGLLLAYNNYFDVYQRICKHKQAFAHDGIRIVTKIDDNNDIITASHFLNLGIEIRHVRNLPPISFAASEREMIATIQKTEGGQVIQNLLTTNEKAYLEHFRSIFEELWSNGIDAKSRIKDIQLGLDNENIEIIQNPEAFEKMLNDLLKTASIDIIGIFSTARAFERQKNSLSFVLLNERFKSTGLTVRILVPEEASIYKIIDEVEKQGFADRIKIRLIDRSMQIKASIVVIDKKYSLAVEVKDDSKNTTKEAIGLVTYSNSSSTVLTYYSIFESFWRQAELYKQLQLHDKMQREFINTAAHELRTPIQPILGAAEILKRYPKNDREKGLVEIVDRNARRLKKLAEDILDVTKIEGYVLNLKKEKFDINEVILENIDNYKQNIEKANVVFTTSLDYDDSIVSADKNGISRVVSNLIDNAIKFLPETEGQITISTKSQIRQESNGVSRWMEIVVEDNGSGIDEEILPKLFTKFATKSFNGIGLGLYISKSIIAAHNGMLVAQNNPSGKGAKFIISLPKGNDSILDER
ncbi:MAG: ATP-binding protein [Candidatus Nitrosocosmicus sp.]